MLDDILHFFYNCVENLWSHYVPEGVLIKDPHLPSIEGGDSSQDIYLPYVVSDITTFFTLMVGIYFPSVTGENIMSALLVTILFLCMCRIKNKFTHCKA